MKPNKNLEILKQQVNNYDPQLTQGSYMIYYMYDQAMAKNLPAIIFTDCYSKQQMQSFVEELANLRVTKIIFACGWSSAFENQIQLLNAGWKVTGTVEYVDHKDWMTGKDVMKSGIVMERKIK